MYVCMYMYSVTAGGTAGGTQGRLKRAANLSNRNLGYAHSPN